MRVLVVDDDAPARKLAAERVRAAGHMALEAADAGQAVEVLAAMSPHVVLSDWLLGGADGLELCRRARVAGPGRHVYFILVSGRRLGREDHALAMRSGVDDFLAKPLSAGLLEARLLLAERLLRLLRRVALLEGLVRVCSYCRRMRLEEGGYEPMEAWLERQPGAELRRVLCPDCRSAAAAGGVS